MPARLLGHVLRRLDSKWSGVVIVGAGLGLRIAGLALVGGVPLNNEAPGYRQMALDLLHHNKVDLYWPPGAPILLLVFHKLFGEGIVVSRAAILPMYVLFSVLLYVLARDVSARGAANLVLLLFALYPSYIRYAFNPSTEYPAAVALLAGVYFGLRVAQRSPGQSSSLLAALAGLSFGALTLIRPSGLALVPLATLYIFWRTRRIAAAAVVLSVSALLISAWTVKAFTATGQWVVINRSNWQNFFLGNNPYIPLYLTAPEGPRPMDTPPALSQWLAEIDSSPPEARDAMYRAAALRSIASRLDLFLLRTFNRFCTFFAFPVHHGEPLLKGLRMRGRPVWLAAGITLVDLAFYSPVMIMAILVVFDFRRLAPEATETAPVPALLGAILVYSAPYWVSISQPRFNFPVVPLFAVLAAAGFESVGVQGAPALSPSGWRRRGAILAIALFCLIQLEWLLIGYWGL